MENKRRYPRFSFSEPVGYQGDGRILEGSLAEDISQTGIKLSVSQFIPLNTLLELHIQLPNQVEVVAVQGKVVWIREIPYRDDAWEIGLHIQPNEAFSSAIQDYISLHQFGSFS